MIEKEMIKNLFNKKFLIGVLLVFILAGGAFFIIFQKNNQTPIIVLTEMGFSPQSITIKQGETVIFKTNRDSQFWPASDIHQLMVYTLNLTLRNLYNMIVHGHLLLIKLASGVTMITLNHFIQAQ